MNKPVAWMFEKDGAYMCIKHDNKVNYDGGIPLYIHPAKELHLSLQKSKETGELLAVTYTAVSYTHLTLPTNREV